MANSSLKSLDGTVSRATDVVVNLLKTEVDLTDDQAEELKTELTPTSVSLAMLAKTVIGGVSAYYKALEETTPGNAARTILSEFSSVVDSIESTSLENANSEESRQLVEIEELPSTSEINEKIIPDETTLLGYGNTGTCVYAGKWRGNDVAVKVVLKLGNNKQVIQEIDALTKLGSLENVLQYYHYQDETDRYHLALELCQTTLQKWVENSSCISPACLSKPSALFQATNGLLHLHKKGLIHRDLKPTNILLSVNDRVVTVKLADFGISKFLTGNSGSTQTCVVGTENWRPPEVLQYIEDQYCFGAEAQKNKIKLTCQSDIFPLGLIFYFVLTNGLRNLFGFSTTKITSNTLNPEYVPLMSQIPDEFIGYSHIIKRMIKFRASERPEAKEVLNFVSKELVRHADGFNLD